MQLLSRRFILRDFVGEDFPAFAAYHANPKSRELYGPDEGSFKRADELFQLFLSWTSQRPRRNFQFAIVRHSGVLIGCAGLRMSDSVGNQAEIGVELDPVYWGRFGYTIEILQCLIDFGFRNLDLVHIIGKSIDANRPVSRLASAFGAQSRGCDTPKWMMARGWRQIEWRIEHDQWLANVLDDSFRHILRRTSTSG